MKYLLRERQQNDIDPFISISIIGPHNSEGTLMNFEPRVLTFNMIYSILFVPSIAPRYSDCRTMTLTFESVVLILI